MTKKNQSAFFIVGLFLVVVLFWKQIKTMFGSAVTVKTPVYSNPLLTRSPNIAASVGSGISGIVSMISGAIGSAGVPVVSGSQITQVDSGSLPQISQSSVQSDVLSSAQITL